ncbi:MAG: hypothetical protein ACYCW6_27970, partial [Candidatus Xenobia bacterium]
MRQIAMVIMCAACLMLSAASGAADESATPTPTPAWSGHEINFQATWIWQNMTQFRSLVQSAPGGVEGGGSLASQNEGEVSHTYTVYFGTRLSRTLDFYLDPEMARGRGIGNALGLGG